MAGKKHQKHQKQTPSFSLEKAPTGIEGLDALTGGGIPRGRITLVAGASGSGKTVLGMEFLVRGAALHGEPGVFVSFEESEEDLAANFASMGFDLPGLVSEGKLFIESIDVAPGLVLEAGQYDLEGLFARLEHAIEAVGARRVILDAAASLFHGLTDAAAVRTALSRLFLWLKARGITSVVTVESETDLARQGLGRSLSDCIVLLSTTVARRIATRYLRIAKYRGSPHQRDEFPFLISGRGISVLPLTSVESDYGVSAERISTGTTGVLPCSGQSANPLASHRGV